MDYTDYLEVLNQCNYINPEVSNSEDLFYHVLISQIKKTQYRMTTALI